MDTLRISFPVENGLPGIDDDPKNPLSRALSTLMGRKNSRLPAFAQAFLIDDTVGEPERCFGVFVRSDGDRIIFFPGFEELPIGIRGSRGNKVEFTRPFNFDHVSLEKDRASWHITSKKSKAHQHATIPKDLGSGRKYWFEMSLANLGKLRVVRKETVATFQVDEKSSTWKKDEFFRAVEKTAPMVIRMPNKQRNMQIFPAISVIVGPPGFDLYQGNEMGLAYGSDYVLGEPSSDEPMTRLIQRFSLDETTDIQTSTVWTPGQLQLPGVLGAPID
jgi:hypothetical protein